MLYHPSKLDLVDVRLKNLVLKASEKYNLLVICGHRGKEEQEKAFNSGASKLKYPNSKHNKTPSLAVDLIPYDPLENKCLFDNKMLILEVSIYIKKLAKELNIKLEYGGDWLKFSDRVHYQIIEL